MHVSNANVACVLDDLKFATHQQHQNKKSEQLTKTFESLVYTLTFKRLSTLFS